MIEDKNNVWNNRHAYFERATITVTRTADDTRLAISDRYSDTRAFGIPNFLSWQVEGWEYETLYEVEIANVTMQSGAPRRFVYEVFIERDALEE